MQYFDYEEVARAAGIPPDKLVELCSLIQHEFPHDEMMYELHVLRACMAIHHRAITLEDALQTTAPATIR